MHLSVVPPRLQGHCSEPREWNCLPGRLFVRGFSGAILGALMTLQSTLAAFPYISMDWASNLELPGQAAQVLGCLWLHIGEGEAVHSLRVLGIDL